MQNVVYDRLSIVRPRFAVEERWLSTLAAFVAVENLLIQVAKYAAKGSSKADLQMPNVVYDRLSIPRLRFVVEERWLSTLAAFVAVENRLIQVAKYAAKGSSKADLQMPNVVYDRLSIPRLRFVVEERWLSTLAAFVAVENLLIQVAKYAAKGSSKADLQMPNVVYDRLSIPRLRFVVEERWLSTLAAFVAVENLLIQVAKYAAKGSSKADLQMPNVVYDRLSIPRLRFVVEERWLSTLAAFVAVENLLIQVAKYAAKGSSKADLQMPNVVYDRLSIPRLRFVVEERWLSTLAAFVAVENLLIQVAKYAAKGSFKADLQMPNAVYERLSIPRLRFVVGERW